MKQQCVSCGEVISELFSLGNQPMANKYPAPDLPAEHEWRQELKAFYCGECLYIYVACNADRSIFFEDYYYLSSVNKELVNHFDQLAHIIAKSHPRLVVDIGSNDGIFLRPLKRLGVTAIGVDPSHNVGAIANENGLETVIGFFNQEVAKKILSKKGPADIIVASSVFTHLDDPGQFFEAAKTLLTDNGVIIIEVEYLGDIVKSIGFERFYFDRPHYYSVTTIEKLAIHHGFACADVEYIAPHGGSIRLTLSRSANGMQNSILHAEESSILSPENILNAFSKFSTSCEELRNSLEVMNDSGERVAGYGCPARFSTITNFADIDISLLPFVVDDSPLKQGLQSPGKRIPIVAYNQSEPVDTYIMFAYEYAASIRKRLAEKRSNIRFIRPVPYTQL